MDSLLLSLCIHDDVFYVYFQNLLILAGRVLQRRFPVPDELAAELHLRPGVGRRVRRGGQPAEVQQRLQIEYAAGRINRADMVRVAQRTNQPKTNEIHDRPTQDKPTLE